MKNNIEYNEEINPPYIKFIMVDEFGNKQVIISEILDSTLGTVMDTLRDALKGVGFHSESVDEYFE